MKLDQQEILQAASADGVVIPKLKLQEAINLATRLKKMSWKNQQIQKQFPTKSRFSCNIFFDPAFKVLNCTADNSKDLNEPKNTHQVIFISKKVTNNTFAMHFNRILPDAEQSFQNCGAMFCMKIS
jgi:hypothetical protein